MANLEKAARLKLQDSFDGHVVFLACCGVVFIMIEIRSREKKNVRLSREDISERFSDGYEFLKVNRAEGNGNECATRIEDLQERKLNFKRVLALVRHGIFAKQQTGTGNRRCKFRVHRHVAKWSAPGAFAENRGFLTVGKVANAQRDDAFGKHDARVDCSRNMAGVHVPGVRHKARAAGNFLMSGFCRNEALNLLREFAGIVRIKRSGNRGKTNHNRSVDQMAFEGFPLTLRAFLLSGSKKTVTLSPY